MNDSEEQRRINQEVDRRLREMEKAVAGIPVQWPTFVGAVEIKRVKVAEPNVAAAGGPPVHLVKATKEDSDEAVGDAFPIVALTRSNSNQILYVVQPTGGLKGSPKYRFSASQPEHLIEWRDLRLPGVYPVKLEQDGGTDGGDAGPTTWTYKVTLDGVLIKSGKAPTRLNSLRYQAATEGLAVIDEKGEITRLIAFEEDGPVICA